MTTTQHTKNRMKTTKQKSREQFALEVADHMNLGSNRIELCEEDGDVTAIIKDGTSITMIFLKKRDTLLHF